MLHVFGGKHIILPAVICLQASIDNSMLLCTTQSGCYQRHNIQMLNGVLHRAEAPYNCGFSLGNIMHVPSSS